MNMTRKLARVERIEELTPIEGADAIELARVGGWRVVVQKNLHTVGDLAVYFEVDSLLPECPLFEKAAGRDGIKTSLDEETGEKVYGYRLKCIRLKGQYSQGLVIPQTDMAELLGSDFDYETAYVQGTDLTGALGVKKYEKYVDPNANGEARSSFPSFIKKTDQTRCLSDATIVNTPDGNVTIDTIVVGDYVLSYNHTNDVNEYKKVTAVSKASKIEDGWFMLKMKSGAVLEVTHNHKIWCEDVGEYVLVSDLVVGNKVKLIE